MNDVQRIAIVDPSDSTRESLRDLLLGVDTVWLEAECSRYEFFRDVVHQSNPDTVVVGLDADHAKALAAHHPAHERMPEITHPGGEWTGGRPVDPASPAQRRP